MAALTPLRFLFHSERAGGAEHHHLRASGAGIEMSSRHGRERKRTNRRRSRPGKDSFDGRPAGQERCIIIIIVHPPPARHGTPG